MQIGWLNTVLWLAITFFAAAVAWAAPTAECTRLAYLDAGTGSMIVQAVIAVVAGAGVWARLHWDKVRSMLGLSRPDQESEPAKPEND